MNDDDLLAMLDDAEEEKETESVVLPQRTLSALERIAAVLPTIDRSIDARDDPSLMSAFSFFRGFGTGRGIYAFDDIGALCEQSVLQEQGSDSPAALASVMREELQYVSPEDRHQEDDVPRMQGELGLPVIDPYKIVSAQRILNHLTDVAPVIEKVSSFDDVTKLLAAQKILKGYGNKRVGALIADNQLSPDQAFMVALMSKGLSKKELSDVVKRTKRHRTLVDHRRKVYMDFVEGLGSMPDAVSYRHLTRNILRDLWENHKIAVAYDFTRITDEKSYEKFKSALPVLLADGFVGHQTGDTEGNKFVLTPSLSGYYSDGTSLDDVPLGSVGTLDRELNVVIDGETYNPTFGEEAVRVVKKEGDFVMVNGEKIEGWVRDDDDYRTHLNEGDHIMFTDAEFRETYFDEGISFEDLPPFTVGVVESGEIMPLAGNQRWYSADEQDITSVYSRKLLEQDGFAKGDYVIVTSPDLEVPIGTMGVIEKMRDGMATIKHGNHTLSLSTGFKKYRTVVSPIDRAIMEGRPVFSENDRITLSPESQFAGQANTMGTVVDVSIFPDEELPYTVRFDDGVVNRYGNKDLLFVELPERWVKAMTDYEDEVADVHGGIERLLENERKRIDPILSQHEQDYRNHIAMLDDLVNTTSEKLASLGVTPFAVETVIHGQLPSRTATPERDKYDFLEVIRSNPSHFIIEVREWAHKNLGIHLPLDAYKYDTIESLHRFVNEIPGYVQRRLVTTKERVGDGKTAIIVPADGYRPELVDGTVVTIHDRCSGDTWHVSDEKGRRYHIQEPNLCVVKPHAGQKIEKGSQVQYVFEGRNGDFSRDYVDQRRGLIPIGSTGTVVKTTRDDRIHVRFDIPMEWQWSWGYLKATNEPIGIFLKDELSCIDGIDRNDPHVQAITEHVNSRLNVLAQDPKAYEQYKVLTARALDHMGIPVSERPAI